MDSGKKYDFGFRNPETGETAQTFIDGATLQKRMGYIARHMGNVTERRLVSSLVPSASLFSLFLLWGNSRSLSKNVKHLNTLWRRKEIM